MQHRTRTKALSWLFSLAMALGMLPGVSLTATAAGSPTLLNCTTGESDGVVYVLTRVTSGFTKGTQYIFVPGSAPKPYLTVLPDGSGILKVEDRQSNGYFYYTGGVNCYVGVVRRTAGFDYCPHGTLNYGASEYNCWAGGVRHLVGGVYTDMEYPYGSKIAVTVKKDGVGWDNARVVLYRGSTRLKELTSGTSDGVYDFGYYAKGSFAVSVDGAETAAYKGDAVSNAKWGADNAVTVSYYTTTVTTSGNEPVTSVELRGDTTDVARVIPACMLGSAVGGLLSELFGCTLPAPHGGMFVLPIMGRPLPYLLALAAGSLVTALGILKKDRK